MKDEPTIFEELKTELSEAESNTKLIKELNLV
jgi:hypothetical protein